MSDASIVIDFSGMKKFADLKEGWVSHTYPGGKAVLTSAAAQVSSKGNKMIAIQWTLDVDGEGSGHGARIYDNIMLEGGGVGISMNKLAALGLATRDGQPDEDGDPTWRVQEFVTDDLIGREVDLKLALKTPDEQGRRFA